MGPKQKFKAREIPVCKLSTAFYRTREVGSTGGRESFHERELRNSIHDATWIEFMSWENARLRSSCSREHRDLQRLGISQMWGGCGHCFHGFEPVFFLHCWLSVILYLSSLVISGGLLCAYPVRVFWKFFWETLRVRKFKSSDDVILYNKGHQNYQKQNTPKNPDFD